MKIFKIFRLILFVFLVASCQNVQDGLSGKKQQNNDEFLVKKKNPLVLPPDYDKLPIPNESQEQETENFDLKKILKKNDKSQTTKVENNTNLEESIIEKIKGN